MKPLNESQLDALDAFVRHMVSVNDTNGALYDFAERAIRTDGGVYWNCKLRGAKDLYARAVAFTSRGKTTSKTVQGLCP